MKNISHPLSVLAIVILILIGVGMQNDFGLLDYITYDLFHWYDDDGDNTITMAWAILPLIAIFLSGCGYGLSRNRNQKREFDIDKVIFVTCCLSFVPFLVIVITSFFMI